MSAKVEAESRSSNSEASTRLRQVEGVILNKIVESINMHPSIGALHSKLLIVELQRDKLQHRVTNLQHQVIDLTKACRSMSENVGRNGRDTKASQPTRFFRSVGLQVAYNNVRPSQFQDHGGSNGILKMSSNHIATNGPSTPLPSVYARKRTTGKSFVNVTDTHVAKQTDLEKGNKIQKLSPNASPGTNALTSPPSTLMKTPSTATTSNVPTNGIQKTVYISGMANGTYSFTTSSSKSPITTPVTNMSPTMTIPVRLTTATPMRPGLQMSFPQAEKRWTISQLPANNLFPARPMPTVSQSMIRPVCRPVTPYVKKYILPPLPPPSTSCMPRRSPKDIPPRPDLTLQEKDGRIVLSWFLKLGSNHAEIQTYQIYACQEPLGQTAPTKAASWKRVGEVEALALPMACTLSQFAEENRYHFIVRGVDVYDRTGSFCKVNAIALKKKLV